MKTATTKRHRLLITDDNATVRNLLDYHSRQRGFDPLLASSGKEAKELISDDIDVVILDLRMPEGDGMEFLQFLAENFLIFPLSFSHPKKKSRLRSMR